MEDDWSGSKNFYIADNVFIGRHDPNKLQSWWTAGRVGKVSGLSSVTSRPNTRSRYTDKATWWRTTTPPIGTMASISPPMAIPTARPTRSQTGCPFPSISTTTISPTWRTTASRPMAARATSACFENRCFNSARGAFSAQPTFGGPLYFYRNLVYDATTGGPLKFVDTPAGVLVYQNTFIGQGRLMGPASNVHFLNNLILGDGFADPVLNLTHLHQLLQLRLQWLPSESKRRQRVRMGFATIRSCSRLSARSANSSFQIARRVQRGNAPGTAQLS